MSSRSKKKQEHRGAPTDTSGATLLGVEAARFYAHEDIARVLLAFALVYNDLRSTLQLVPAAIPRSGASLLVKGERSGIAIQINRLIAGILHELLELMEKQKTTIESASLRTLIERLPTDPRASWENLEAAAFSKALVHTLRRVTRVRLPGEALGHGPGRAALASGPPKQSRNLNPRSRAKGRRNVLLFDDDLLDARPRARPLVPPCRTRSQPYPYRVLPRSFLISNGRYFMSSSPTSLMRTDYKPTRFPRWSVWADQSGLSFVKRLGSRGGVYLAQPGYGAPSFWKGNVLVWASWRRIDAPPVLPVRQTSMHSTR